MLTDILATLSAVLLSASLLAYFRRRKYTLPPGPQGWPIIGNVFDIPHINPWSEFVQMSRRHGSDILYFNVLRMPLIILNSPKAIGALLEKRSNIYSDRLVSTMVEMTSSDRLITMMPYGDVWRTHRRDFHQHFNENAVGRYRTQFRRYPRMFLKFLLDSPEEFLGYSRWFAGALILDVVYGFDIRNRHDAHLLAAQKALGAFNAVINSSFFVVDSIPILKHIPSWLPGAGFKRQAAEWKSSVLEMYEGPLKHVLSDMAAGVATPSVAASLLAKVAAEERTEKFEFDVQRVAGTAFAGGQDTSMTTMHTFFLAMLVNSGVLKAAQEALDTVIGVDRLPELEDQASLPLITAILYECLRWRPVVPVGVPHRASVNDKYEDCHIPAGAVVIGNAWSILHNEDIYPNPDEFNPYRFLTPEGALNKAVPLPEAAFGFGRRVCPGRHFALQSLWMAIAHVLATFDIEKPVDVDGNIVEPSGEYAQGLIVGPLPFKASIKPRSPAAAELIRAAALAEG